MPSRTSPPDRRAKISFLKDLQAVLEKHRVELLAEGDISVFAADEPMAPEMMFDGMDAAFTEQSFVAGDPIRVIVQAYDSNFYYGYAIDSVRVASETPEGGAVAKHDRDTCEGGPCCTDGDVDRSDVEIEECDVRVGWAVISSGAYEGHFRAYFADRERAEKYLEWCQSEGNSDSDERMTEPFIVPACVASDGSDVLWANTLDEEAAVRALSKRCHIESHGDNE